MRQGVERFAFTPAVPTPLALLRVGVSVLGLVQLWVLRPHLLAFYGNFGLVQWAVIETSPEEWLPSIGKLCMTLRPLGMSSAACVYGVFGLYALGLVGLAIGWQTRVAAVIAWSCHSLAVNSGYFSLYGVDTMLHICLFYFVWMPVGATLSLDRRLRGQLAVPTPGARLALRTLQIHLCIIYLDGGIAKLRGEQWWNGEAIWRALMNPEFAVFDVSWLARFPGLAAAVGWSVLLVEVGYALFIWPRRTRLVWVAATVALHLGIGLTMGLWMFSLIMILMTCCAFGVPMVRRWQVAERWIGIGESC